MQIDVVVGGQFGSEAKGHVTQRLLNREDGYRVNVRVAGPNAGHSGHTEDGIKLAFRQLPMGALIPGVDCVIAAGSEIEPEVLIEEIDMAIRYAEFDPSRLYVDGGATLLEHQHKEVEADALLTTRIGSTGKGIGAARADRLLRNAQQVGDDMDVVDELHGLGVNVLDTAYWLAEEANPNYVVIEGTQGYGLGLHAGWYPFCTSSDCRAIDFLAMAGINPWFWPNAQLSVWVVARVFPIRVAGNSGPLNNETSWEALGLEPEYTTVTQKMRRVGLWDSGLVRSAVLANGGEPTVKLAITMLDQKFPEVAGSNDIRKIMTDEVVNWLTDIEDKVEADVHLLTTGPNSGAFV